MTTTNTPPSISPLPDVEVTLGYSISSISVVVTDADNDMVTVTVSGLPDGLSYSSGSITGTVSSLAATGDYIVTVSADDGVNNPVEASFVMTVEEMSNSRPVIGSIANQTLQVGKQIEAISIVVVDADEDDVTVTVTGLPPGLSYDDDDGEITGILDGTLGHNRLYRVLVKADDGVNSAVQKVFSITTINLAPIIEVDDGFRLIRGETITPIRLVVSDPESLDLTTSIEGIPSGLDWDEEYITGKLDSDVSLGDSAITVKVNDKVNFSETSIPFSVIDRPKPLEIPSEIEVVPGDERLDFRWEYLDRSIAGLRFQFQYKHNKKSDWLDGGMAEGSESFHRIPDLAGHQLYDWRLRAVSVLDEFILSEWASGQTRSSGDSVVLIGNLFDSGLVTLNANSRPSGVSRYNNLPAMPIAYSFDDILSDYVDIHTFHNYSNILANYYVVEFLQSVRDVYFEAYINHVDTLRGYLRARRTYSKGSVPTYDQRRSLGSRIEDSGYVEFGEARRGKVSLSGGPYNFGQGHYLWFNCLSDDVEDYGSAGLRLYAKAPLPARDLNAVTPITVGESIIARLEKEDVSDHRAGSYAKYFTLDLTDLSENQEKEVAIEVEAEFDSYLYLLLGERGGAVLEENDDINAEEDNYNSHIVRKFSRGTYTIEVTTYDPSLLGRFIVNVS